MPQELLPLFSEDTTPVSALVSYRRKDGTIYYFLGSWPVFSHAECDEASFRLFTSQLYVDGHCTQSQIVRAFGVTAISVKRAVKKYREGGPAAFYQRRAPERKPRVLTAEVLERAQALLDEGKGRGEVAETLGIKPDTLYRAVRAGRLVEGKKRWDRSGADAK
jgi:transposase